jgi:uncharacterized cupin superfamily protein
VRKVNLARVELDETIDVAGFRHARTSVRARLGARRIGATVYEAFAGAPIWPYGYHRGVEEWLYVLAGAPVLREPAGERVLAPGDLVCFPSGHLGAHALAGPGRVAIFSTGDHVEPWLSVYPDSDKVSGPDGIFPRESAVGYWHREGLGLEDDPGVVRREPASAARRPVVNVLAQTGRLGSQLLAERVETTVLELAPGAGAEPYHYEYGRETWLLVLAGTPTLRHPAGTDVLAPGDLVCFPEGPEGARQLANASADVTRAVWFTTLDFPANVHYPDSGEWVLHHRPGEPPVTLGRRT